MKRIKFEISVEKLDNQHCWYTISFDGYSICSQTTFDQLDTKILKDINDLKKMYL